MADRRNRMALLADTAIDLLAEGGMRALTHRAVDTRAGLPLGTTSAYLRTRQALIEAVVHRLADLDRADRADHELPTDVPPPQPRRPLTAADLDQLATATGDLLDRWLTVDRHRNLARYACLLEATHRPELRSILEHGTVLRAQARDLLARAGAADPRRQGDQFVAFVDGLLFDRLVGAGTLSAPQPGTPASRADLTAAVRTLLRTFTGS